MRDKIGVSLAIIFAIVGTALAPSSACKPSHDSAKAGAPYTPGQIGPFVIPASWQQAAWYVDGSNASGCASDNNRTCSLSTCGTSGDGPCLTMSSIASRWGTYSPRLQQATTITIMSSMVASDVSYFNPFVEGNMSYLSVSCALDVAQQAWTGTLGTVTARNMSGGTLLRSTFTTGGVVATDQLLVNYTHPSRAWVASLQSGTTWNLTQPVAPTCVPPTCTVTEVNAWASGDSVIAYNPSNVYTPQANPVASDIVNGEGFGVWITGCDLQSVYGTEQSPFVGNKYTILVDTVSNRFHQDSTWGGVGAPVLVNTDVIEQYHGTMSRISAGKIGFGNKFAVFNGGILDNDVVLGDTVFWYGLPAVQTDEGGNAIVSAYFSIGLTAYSYTSVQTQIWGPGALYVNAGGWLQYPTGIGGAVSSLLLTGAMHIAGSTTACSHTSAAPDVVDCGISVTPAHLDAAQGVAGFGGYAYSPGGGVISNVAQ